MAPGEPGGGPPAEFARAQARAGIHGWVTRNAATLRRMTPRAILTGMAAAAFAPILAPLVTTVSADPAAVQALLAQFGGAGAGYLVAIVQQFADRQGDRAERPAVTEERLRELLRAVFDEGLSDANSAQTRATINELVLDVKGVDTLLQAAAESDDAGLLSHLVRALSQEHSFEAVVLSTLDSLLSVSAEHQSTQRDSYELQNEILFETRMLRRELTRRLPAVPDGRTVPSAGDGEAAPGTGLSPVVGPCPYPGLAPFQERDAYWFFGRDALVVKLVNALGERIYGSTPLVVAGVSGAGKSSVLRAGLIPELRAGGLAGPGSAEWPIRAMRPDRHPLEQLSLRLGELAGLISSDVYAQLLTNPGRAAMIVRQGLLSQEERRRTGIVTAGSDPIVGISGGPDSGPRRLILVIDQFEEIFTRCHDDEERTTFIDALCAITAGSRDDPPAALVVMGLQIAFIERCTAYPKLRPALSSPVTVDTMTADELRDAIESPARQASLTVQSGLVPAMLGDIGAVGSRTAGGLLTYDPGRLPLLAHALLETWKARDGRELTIAAYQKAGGVQGALANTAESLLRSLDENQRLTLRRLLVYHLVAASPFTEDARRHISRQALLDELPAEDRKRADDLVDRLKDARLVTEDAGGVQIAHEALLRYWPTLAEWLDEERDWRREVQRVAGQAREWAAADKDATLLPRGIALAIIEEKVASARTAGLSELSELAEEFLRAARQQRARARVRRRFRIVGVAATIAAIAILSVTYLQVRAINSRKLALAQSRAETLQLLESANQSTNNPVLSLLLDVEAYRVGGATADNGLLSAQQDFFTSTLTNPAGAGSSVTFDPAAPLLAVAGQDAITVFRVTTHQRAITLRGGSPFYAAAFSASGALLAGAEQNGTTIVWDVKTWKPVTVLGTANGLSVNAVAFQPDGTLIATAGISGVVTLWDLHGRQISTFRAGTTQDGVTINGIAFSPDGARLAAACADRTVRLWNVRGKPRLVKLTGHSAPVRAVAFSTADSALLASADDDGAIRLWNGRTGARLGSLPGSGPQPIDALAFSTQGALLASGGGDGVVRLWDIDTRAQIGALAGPSSRVTGLAFSRNGQTIASVEADPTVGLWNVTAPPQPGASSIAAATTAADARSPVATIGGGTAMGLWNPLSAASYATAALPLPLAVSAAARGDIPPSVALSPNGDVVAATLGNQDVWLWSTGSGHKLGTLTAPQPLTSVAYSPATDDPIMAAGGSDGNVYLWQPGAKQPMSVSGDLASEVTSIAFSPDGALLAAGSADGTFLLVARGPDGKWTPFTPPTLPLDTINTVAFSANGTLLATGSASGTVRLWNISDPDNPVNVASLTGPAGQVISVAFGEDGMLAASSDDDSIRVWNVSDPAAPALMATFTGLADPTSVAWEPRTRTLVGAAPDGTLLTWDTNPGNVANRICQALAGYTAEVSAIVASGYPPACP
jgi:WD40 repeat protein